MSIICLDYILWMLRDLIKENSFTLKKTRSRRYPAETMTNAGYTDDLVLFANPPGKIKITRWIHILHQQQLINWKWCQHIHTEGLNCYWQIVNYKEVWSLKSDKIKQDSFQAVNVSVLLYGCTISTQKKKKLGEKC